MLRYNISMVSEHHSHSSPHPKLPLIAGAAAVCVSLILTAIKSYAWLESGSSSILASLIDSVIDILISATTFAALWYAARPADYDHRHGHGKAEGIAALFQAAFIFGSSVFVYLQTIRFIAYDENIMNHDSSIIIMVIAIALNLALITFQSYVKKKTDSLAIEADRAHYTGDILIHVGVIASLFFDKHFAFSWGDPLLASAICLWLVYNAYHIGHKAFDMLLDRELEPKERNKIIAIIKSNKDILGAHDLRTRRSGQQIKMALDIEVDPALNIRDAHNIALALEHSILEHFPHSEVFIHVDPHGEAEDERHKEIKEMHRIV